MVLLAEYERDMAAAADEIVSRYAERIVAAVKEAGEAFDAGDD